MNNMNRPRARKAKVEGQGHGVASKGESTGSAPVNNTGNYEGRKPQAAPPAQQRPTGRESINRPAGTGPAVQRPFRAGETRDHSQTTRDSGSTPRSVGGGKIGLILIAAVVIFFGSRLFGGNGGNDSGNTITSLFSSMMSSSSLYDFSGGDLLSSVTGNTGSANNYFTSSSDANTAQPDTTVASGARSKFTRIPKNGQATVTILVYMCGTDLESQNGMATADIKEMLNAKISSKVNLLIYTGGCARWKNSVISSSVNQIYQIKDGELILLEADMGRASMTSPSTLQEFITYGKDHFPADRMCLILWDHGGGSVSGYGYDEKTGRGQSMTLSGINTALKGSSVKFDFIGFDACLMATVENGLMLSQYADYMIASEETEPGVGWYYTNWLTRLSADTSMSTVQVGKLIADDFVEVCAKQCRGQATTLSVVDLAELQATVPEELKTFSVETSEMIREKQYKTISTARSRTREFAQSSRIDQIDLVDFARNMGTKEGTELAEALLGAVKYNRTGGGINHAYGLSIYFPYKKTTNVSKAVSTYHDIGMDEEYTRCIQAFASLETSGQIAAGTSPQSYGTGSYSISSPDIIGSLLGGGTGYYSGSSYGDSLGGMLGDLLGGSSSSSLIDLLGGRAMSTDETAAYINENHFQPELLVWRNGSITLPESQWELVTSLTVNVFYDDGEGYIDLGTDNVFELSEDGMSLLDRFNGTWLSIDGYVVPYYYLDTVEIGDDYEITGYVPVYLTRKGSSEKQRVNLIICFDSEHYDSAGDADMGYIAGAQIVYPDDEPGVEAKNMIGIGQGDRIQPVCDFYSYDGTYQSSHVMNVSITLGKETRITNTPIGGSGNNVVTFCFTDIYQQRYWTPAI